jgi:pimeloyl-ACP methyl ester carboxylesterase
VDDAVALLRHLGVERAHIVGHSGGGRIALQLALDSPEMVHSLVVLEPAGVGPVPSRQAFVDEVIEPAMERYRAGDPVGAVDVFMGRGAYGSSDWRKEIERMVPGGPKQAEQDAATFFEDPTTAGQFQFDEEKAEKLSQRLPLLYVWGSETLSFLKEGRDLFHAWIPHAEDHVVDGVGHSLQMEDPLAVAEGIADFLRRHPLDNNSN